MASIHKLRYAKVKFLEDISSIIAKVGQEDTIHFIWQRQHASPLELDYSDGLGGRVRFEDFFLTDKYRDIYSGIKPFCTIMLEGCSAGGRSEYDKALEEEALLHPGKKVFSFDKGKLTCSKGALGVDVENEKGETFSLPQLNMASAIAYLAKGSRVIAPTVASDVRNVHFTSIHPINGLFNTPEETMSVCLYPKENISKFKSKPGGVSFEVPLKKPNRRMQMKTLPPDKQSKEDILPLLKKGVTILFNESKFHKVITK